MIEILLLGKNLTILIMQFYTRYPYRVFSQQNFILKYYKPAYIIIDYIILLCNIIIIGLTNVSNNFSFEINH